MSDLNRGEAAPLDLIIGDWRVRPALNRIERGDEVRGLQPKVMDLLTLLAARPGETVTRETLHATLWPDMLVGDDTVARCVLKLRRGLGGDARHPAYVETVSKRGYRLVAPVRPVPIGQASPAAAETEVLIERARDAYGRYTRHDNETAVALYQRALAIDPRNAQALAGLAMAEVQRAIRWLPGADAAPARLDAALTDRRLDHPQARAALSQARALSGRAAAIDPDGSLVLQAQGLVRSTHGDLQGAEQAYRRILARHPADPGALINLADVLSLRGQAEPAVALLEQAYERLTTYHDLATQRLGAWVAPLGVEIARRRLELGDRAQAETWLLRVLDDAPFDAPAAGALTRLRAAGVEQMDGGGGGQPH